jgi:hypothetical protein
MLARGTEDKEHAMSQKLNSASNTPRNTQTRSIRQ